MNKLMNITEIVSLNIIGVSVIGWLNSVASTIPAIVSVLVGLSVIALNVIKIYKEIKK